MTTVPQMDEHLTPLEVQVELKRFFATFSRIQGWIAKMVTTQVLRKYSDDRLQ